MLGRQGRGRTVTGSDSSDLYARLAARCMAVSWLCVVWLSALYIHPVHSQGSVGAPPYDAGTPESVSFPVDPEVVWHESDPKQHRPFGSATYTYHGATHARTDNITATLP